MKKDPIKLTYCSWKFGNEQEKERLFNFLGASDLQKDSVCFKTKHISIKGLAADQRGSVSHEYPVNTAISQVQAFKGTLLVTTPEGNVFAPSLKEIFFKLADQFWD